ncbi:MAG: hypothetical protein QF819_01230 [Gemmatimonadota bacterium]|jgi:hypothetical protein|nr:hypothetical protein [Gemmatimonadota bacterium]MDP6801790.1 hypothetical protein [Gemmatimonadota bacterium]MDP7031134.1 hypothetical protein [Gemmatimonadota bacterium]
MKGEPTGWVQRCGSLLLPVMLVWLAAGSAVAPGWERLPIDTLDEAMPSGVYFVRILVDGEISGAQKMLMLR